MVQQDSKITLIRFKKDIRSYVAIARRTSFMKYVTPSLFPII